MSSRFLLPALCLGLAAFSILPAQGYQKARSTLQRAARGKDFQARNQALEALVKTGDAQGLADLLTLLVNAQKDIDKLRSTAEKTGKKLRDAWKSVDRQVVKGGSVSGVESASKKSRKISKQLDGMSDQLVALENWRRSVAEGIGGLFDAAGAAERTGFVSDLMARMKKERKPEGRALLARTLTMTWAPEARQALSELALRAEEVAVRTIAVEALGQQGDPALAELLGQALKDEAHPVRVAAAQGLGRMPSLAGVPLLIEAVGTSSGAALDNVIEALEDLLGRTYQDNQTLWRDWWKANAERLNKTMADLDDENPVRRAAAMSTVGKEGLLAGVRKLLYRKGLGPVPAARRSPEARERAARSAEERKKAREARAKAADTFQAKSDDDPLLDSMLDAVGTGISLRRKPIRERMSRELLLNPLRRTRDHQRELDYLAAVRGVRTETVRKLLLRYASPKRLDDRTTGEPMKEEKRERYRKVALTSLGWQANKEAIAPLDAALNGPDAKEEGQLIAVASLERLGLTGCIESLISGVSSRTASVKKASQEALANLTGQTFGEDYRGWRKWWQKAGPTFKPRVVAEGEDEDKGGKKRSTTSFYGIDTKSKHLVYVLDISGSMNATDVGKDGTSRISAAKDELIKSITALPDDAMFNIIFYNHEHHRWKKKMVQATSSNRSAANKWIRDIKAIGATNIFDPLELAFQIAGRGTHDKSYKVTLDTIFFLSDGQPNRGRIVRPRDILREIRRLNELKKVTIHTIGVGKEHDANFMRSLSELSDGSYVAR